MSLEEEKQAGWDTVLASMPPHEREAFLEWWKEMPSEPIQIAAAGFDWQALIARGWRARARQNIAIEKSRVIELHALETENTTLRHQHAAALAKIKKLEDFCDELKEK